MSNYSPTAVYTVAAQSAPSWIMAAISTFPLLMCYDEFLLNNGRYMVVQTHMAATPDHKIIRPIRVFQYGTGLLTGGILVFSADAQRRESYPIFTDTTNDGNLLLQQDFTQAVTGHEFDVVLYLSGVGLKLGETVMEFEVVQ